MRGILVGLIFLGLAAPVKAGIYNTVEIPISPPPESIRSQVGQLKAVAVKPTGPLDRGSMRLLYLRQTEELEKALQDGTFSTVDRVNLGACYLRLGLVPKAIQALGKGPETKHFLIELNLASAYFMEGNLELAARYQERALDHWPEAWWGFKYGQPEWYRKCELLFLRLLKSRLAESSTRTRDAPDVDPLFPGLRFVGPGPDGAYEAGGLARSMRDKLPSDAVGIAFQMVWWYPQDPRLYWLLAELLNASGHVQPAYEIIAELADTGRQFKNLREHRKVLERASRLLAAFPLNARNVALLQAAMFSIPHGNLAPPGVGTAANALGTAVSMEWEAALPMWMNQPQGISAPPPPASPLAVPLFNWKHVTVGFAFGFLVAALVGFQWQEWRRRRITQPIDDEETAPRTGIKG